MLNKTITSLLFLALAFWACKKTDFENVEFAEHGAEFAFPLFTTTLKMDELMYKVLNDSLSSDTLRINPDNTMTLIYTGDVAEKKADYIDRFLTGGYLPVEDTLFYAPFKPVDGVTIRQANLSGGVIGVTIGNPFPQPVTGNFYIPQMTKDGKQMVIPFSLPASTLFPPTTSMEVNVAGQELKSDNNTLFFRYEAYLPNGTRVKFPNFGTTPTVYMGFNNLTFSYLEGYWGYSVNSLTRDTIEIDINQTDLDGGVTIKSPKITMTISNSWGFPTRGYIKYLSFIGQDGKEYPLKSTAFNNDSLDFAYPSYVANEIGQTKYTYVTLDETNSNIAEIFNAQPTRLIYDVDGIANAKRDSSIIGFLTDKSVIRLSMKVELLLEGAAKNFGAEQTVDLNFGEYSDLDTANVESVEFKLVTENRTPISTALQIYFQDERGNTLDSLFSGTPKFIMESAPVNSNGTANGAKRTETFVPMDAARFDRIRSATKALMQTYFTTADGGLKPVKLLATDQAVVKMGVKVKTRFKG